MNEYCEECIKRCHPSDPRTISLDPLFRDRYPNAYPKYLSPLCHSCPEYKPLEETEEQLKWTGKQWDTVEQIRAVCLYMQKKLNEHIDKSKSNKYTSKYNNNYIPYRED